MYMSEHFNVIPNYTPRYLSVYWIHLLNFSPIYLEKQWESWTPSSEWISSIEKKINKIYDKNVIVVSGPYYKQDKYRLFHINKRSQYMANLWHRHINQGGDVDSSVDHPYALIYNVIDDTILIPSKEPIPNTHFSQAPLAHSDNMDTKFYLTNSHHDRIYSNRLKPHVYLPTYREHRIRNKLSHCVFPDGYPSKHQSQSRSYVHQNIKDCIIAGGIWKTIDDTNSHRTGDNSKDVFSSKKNLNNLTGSQVQ